MTEQMKHNLVVTRIFNAPVEQVWKVWSESEYVMQWWGPDGFISPSAEIDFRVGGTSLVCMRAPKEFGGQDLYNTWVYKKIVPMQVIEFIQNLADKDGNIVEPVKIGMPPDFPKDMRTEVIFNASGSMTEITVTEYDWTVGQMLEMSKMGLEQCLNKMAAIFAKI
jgi:uncharacterized protein YndB with AHSA1/START domain